MTLSGMVLNEQHWPSSVIVGVKSWEQLKYLIRTK